MARLAYSLKLPPQRTSCVLFASPHSGRDYTESFLKLTQLDTHTIRSSEDAYIDQLFGKAPKFGSPLLRAMAPRAYVDMNRDEDELDPALIEGVSAARHNPRVISGLGVIPRVVSNGRHIYAGKIPLWEAQWRIHKFWHPYHTALQTQLDIALDRFGCAILIDCHSMPHEALDLVAFQGGEHPDVVLGDRFGASASEDVVEAIEAAFVDEGFRVAKNTPFAGAYTVQRHGRPSLNMHAVQIEIDRSLYMDEKEIRPNENFDNVRDRLTRVIERITDYGRLRSVDVAAE